MPFTLTAEDSSFANDGGISKLKNYIRFKTIFEIFVLLSIEFIKEKFSQTTSDRQLWGMYHDTKVLKQFVC